MGKLARSPARNARRAHGCHGTAAARGKTIGHCGAAGISRPLRHPAQVTLEDGAVLCFDKALSSDLPARYHTLRYLDERDTRLIVTPEVCYLPERLRMGLVGAARATICWSMGHWRFRRFAQINRAGPGSLAPESYWSIHYRHRCLSFPKSEAPIFQQPPFSPTRFICVSRKSPEPWPCEWIFNDLPRRARSSTLTRA